MILFRDRVGEKAAPGALEYTLSGVKAGYASFADSFPQGSRIQYCADGDGDFEVGEGIFSNGVISRDLILGSSDGVLPVDWAIGSVNIVCVVAAATVQSIVNRGVYLNVIGELSATMPGLMPFYPPTDMRILSMVGWVGEKPIGSDVVYALSRNGVLVAEGSVPNNVSRGVEVPLSVSLTPADYINIEVTAVGDTFPGTNLTVHLK